MAADVSLEDNPWTRAILRTTILDIFTLISAYQTALRNLCIMSEDEALASFLDKVDKISIALCFACHIKSINS